MYYLLANIGFDTAENEPAKKLQNFAIFSQFSCLMHPTHLDEQLHEAQQRVGLGRPDHPRHARHFPPRKEEGSQTLARDPLFLYQIWQICSKKVFYMDISRQFTHLRQLTAVSRNSDRVLGKSRRNETDFSKNVSSC